MGKLAISLCDLVGCCVAIQCTGAAVRVESEIAVADNNLVIVIVKPQLNCKGKPKIGTLTEMSLNTMDSHHVQRHVEDGWHVRNEGYVEINEFAHLRP